MNELEKQYMTEEHHQFRRTFRDFLDKEVLPNIEEWEERGMLPKDIFLKFGEMGYFGLTQEEKYGGLGLDFWYDVIYIEEVAKCISGGFSASISAHPYLSMSHIQHEGSEYIKEKYLPKAMTGEWHGALAITEPHAGSDVAGIKTTAVREGNEYVINGSKCFITNGVSADYIVVACKTKDTGSSGISMIIVDTDTPGLSRNNLKKLGWKASDTAELAFDNVRVPVENLLGEENKGFYYIMQRFELERLTLALGAIASCEWALEYTQQYMSERKAFGRTINKFQVLRHRIAQMHAELQAVKTFTYQTCRMYTDKIYCVKEASMCKLLATELSDKVAYQCLQMFGGYGYMEEYKIARFFRDSRLGTIGGGSSEIMLEIISKMVIDDVSYSSQKSVDSSQLSVHSIEDIFQTLPSRLKKEKAKDVELNVLFEFENDLKFSVSIKDSQLTVNREPSTTNAQPSTVNRQPSTVNLIITTTTETYIGVETGKINPQEAFMTGKIKVSDLGVMMQFGTLFKKFNN